MQLMLEGDRRFSALTHSKSLVSPFSKVSDRTDREAQWTITLNPRSKSVKFEHPKLKHSVARSQIRTKPIKTRSPYTINNKNSINQSKFLLMSQTMRRTSSAQWKSHNQLSQTMTKPTTRLKRASIARCSKKANNKSSHRYSIKPLTSHRKTSVPTNALPGAIIK